MEARQEEGSIQRRDAEGAELRGEDGHPGLGVGKLDAWGRWLERVVGPKSEAFGPGWVMLREGVFSATSKAGETMVVSRKLLTWEVVVTRGAGFSITAHADGVSVEAAQLMALEMALVMQVGCEGWTAEKARFFAAWDRGEGTTENTEHTEHTDGTENRENWDMGQDREEVHHEGTKDTKGEDRPDLELERLVMGDEADGVRPSEGWLVREDVVRGAVEMIAELAVRNRPGYPRGLSLWGKAWKAEALNLLEQVEALTAQLEEEEERMVRRLREEVLGAPRAVVINGGFSEYPRPMVGEDVPFAIGDQVALVRLTPDGLGLAGDVDGPARTGTDGHGGRLPDIKAMAEAWVRRVRGDALVNPEAGCGCALGDLMPCNHNTCDCMPARRFFCLECDAPTYQGCLGTPVLPPQCYECSGPTVLWPEGAPVPEKVTTKNTDHTEEGAKA